MSKMDVDGSFVAGFDADSRRCRYVPLSAIDSPILVKALDLWNGLKAKGLRPARTDVTPRLLKPILRNTSLVKVMDGGADYEYRIVGDAFVQAHGRSFQGLRWSETSELSPGFHKFIKPVYDRVVRDGEPLAMRGWIERGGVRESHIYCEYLYLPLGEPAVDHILIAAVYLRRDGLDHVAAPKSSFTQ